MLVAPSLSGTGTGGLSDLQRIIFGGVGANVILDESSNAVLDETGAQVLDET